MAASTRTEIAEFLRSWMDTNARVADLAERFLALEEIATRRHAYVPNGDIEIEIIRAIGQGALSPGTLQKACEPSNPDAVRRAVRQMKGIGVLVKNERGLLAVAKGFEYVHELVEKD